MSAGRVLYFISGLSIGVTAALLWAPRAGGETRRSISDGATKGRHFVRRQAVDASNSIRETAERGKQAVKVTSEGVSEALGRGKAILIA